MKITLKTLQNQTFTMEMEDSKTVKEFKQAIETEKGSDYAVPSQKLIYAGKILNDDDLLSVYGIEETKFVVLMVTKAKPAPVEAKSSSASTSAPVKSAAESEPKTAAPSKPAATAAPSAPAAPTSAVPSMVTAESQMVTGNDLESVIRNMMEMGYERDQVERALHASFNNPERAVEYLISGQMPIDEEVAADLIVENRQPQRATSGENPLEFLRNQPQYQQMCQMLRQSPHLLDTFMQQLRTSNPQLLELIRQNQSAFVRMVNEQPNQTAPATPAGQSRSAPTENPPGVANTQEGAFQIAVSQEDKEAIDRLKALGFPEDMVVQAYFACEKNENLAANFLLSSNFDD